MPAVGLSTAEAQRRLAVHGRNQLRAHEALSRLRVLARQLRSPLLLLLLFAAGVSLATGEMMDAGIVLLIVAATVLIGAHREYGAETAAAALRARVHTRVIALRDGAATRVPIEDIVPLGFVPLPAPLLAGLITVTAAYVAATELVKRRRAHPTPQNARLGGRRAQGVRAGA